MRPTPSASWWSRWPPGLVYAYKHSEAFRNIVNAAFAVVKRVLVAYLQILRTELRVVFAAITGIVKGAVAAIKAYIRGISAVVGFVKSAFENVRSAIGSKLKAAVAIVKSVPSRIKGALGNLGGLLLHAGEDLINGLLRGIENKLGALKSKLASVTHLIPKLKGPPATDKKLLRGNGPDHGGLVAGIDDGIPELKSRLRGTTNLIPDMQISSSALGGGSAPGGSGLQPGQRLRLVVDGQEFSAYVDDRADSRVGANAGLGFERRRARPVNA